MAGAVDWGFAEWVAIRAAGREPFAESYHYDSLQPDFDRLTAQAEQLVEAETGLRSLAGPARARVTDRVSGSQVRRSWDQTHTVNAGLLWSSGPWQATLATQYEICTSALPNISLRALTASSVGSAAILWARTCRGFSGWFGRSSPVGSGHASMAVTAVGRCRW